MRLVLIIATALMLYGCSTMQKARSKSKVQTTTKVEEQSITRERITESYGDTLLGSLPVMIIDRAGELKGLPIVYNARSAGVRLRLVVDTSGISYEVIATPREKVTERIITTTRSEDTSSKAKESTLDVERKGIGIPWWLWIILLVLLLYAVWRSLRKFSIL